jgi:alpha-ribazole phosphatase
VSALWVARHAPVTVKGVCYGQCDVPTTLDALAAATTIAAELERVGALATVDRVWTSPWARTRPVAEALAARLGLPVSVDARLSELSFGAWEGRPYAELEASDGARFTSWMSNWETEAAPGGERVADLHARLSAWRSESPSGLAVTHAGPIRMLRALARGTTYAAVVREPVEHLLPERIGA